MKMDFFGISGSWLEFPAFFSPTNPNNIVAFVVSGMVTTVVSFVALYFWGFKDSDVDNTKDAKKRMFSKKRD